MRQISRSTKIVKTKALTENLMGSVNSRGFTLIEMVVVIALISILAAVALPRMLDTYDNAHEAAVFGAGGAMASAVVLVHNHPSGDPTPSKADIDMTNKLYALASQFNIVVHDHLIIGRVDEVSFKNLGLLEPQASNF